MDAKVLYDVFHLNYWDWRVALDLFLGGLGVGAYLFAIFVSWYYKEAHPEVSKVGAIIAPIATLGGLFFLLLELGQPLRAYHMLFSFHPTSPLWWGGWLQGVFLVIAIKHAQLWLRGKPEEAVLRKKLGFWGVPFALVVGGYHGFLMTIVKAHPLWNAGPATVTALLGFTITGIAAVVLVLCLSSKAAEVLGGIPLTRDILGAAIAAQLFTIFMWTVALFNGPKASAQALHELNAHYGLLFWGVAVGVGLVAPMVIGVREIVREGADSSKVVNTQLPLVTSGMVLVGALVFRYIILVSGQAY